MQSYPPLSCKGSSAYTISRKVQPSLMLALPGSDAYASLSRHIAAVYREAYRADINVSYPLLMGLVDDKGAPLAALGIRGAAEESPLFLESYLDQPAERCLHAITGQAVPRHAIAEAGNLASCGKNDIAALLYGLACHLEQEHIQYILFTGTVLLRRYLHSLGLYPHVLGQADPARLGANAARWGNYYETRPKVMAGSVAGFRQGLEHYFRHGGKAWQ